MSKFHGVLHLVIVVATLSLTTACSEKSSVSADSIAAVADSTSEGKIKELESRLAYLEFENNLSQRREAWLEPSDERYRSLDVELGRLTVAVSGLRPFGTGSEVDITFGNPLFADLTSVQAKIEWGSNDKQGNASEANKRQLDWKPTRELKAGAWTKFTVRLKDYPPGQLGWIKVSEMKADNLALRSYQTGE